MIHFSFYVPVENADDVRSAVFAAGAGKIGNYDSCSFEIKGRGQFRPLKGSQPFIGQTDSVEYVDELKIEMVCEEHVLGKVIEALKASHPYETPAYYAIKTLSL